MLPSEFTITRPAHVLTTTVTRFGTGAKVGCPKQFLGQEVVLVICKTSPYESKKHVTFKNVECVLRKTVTRFGTGAKIDCPKEHLGKTAHIVIDGGAR